MNYKKLNNYIGWAVFLIATIVYVLTLEQTTSLWDCGEYITTAFKLEVGHPPGAPLFMMLGRLFTVFANPESAAYMVNLMSALSSSFTILFLFWSITMIARKIVLSPNDNLFSVAKDKATYRTTLSTGEKWAVLGSGFIGALAYTFTDSFWFSAVEGEVYAMSSFFTALVVWAILKWEAELTDQALLPEEADVHSKNADRWMVFIFFMVGLSIGVHLLNLLCIPAIAYIIYFKKYKETTVSGFIITGVIGIFTLGIIQSVIIPVTINLAGTFERVFNTALGMPFNSGAIFFFILLTAAIIVSLLISRKKGMQVLNTAVWSGTALLIGYTCFAMIVIRSNANPPLDENDPENLVSLEAYLKREQYGDWPILYGPYFNADKTLPTSEWGDRSDVYLRRFVVQDRSGLKDIAGYERKDLAEAEAKKIGGQVVEKYFKSYDGENQKRKFVAEQSTFFPRMYSPESRHVNGYISWSGASATKTPTFGENLNYFFSYQVGWMYWRYFMWNFAGRQSDEQGHGNARDGNWISGLNFIDKYHVGDQSQVPSIISENPSYNKFFMLPLALGLIGFVFTLARASKSWWFITLLFLLTGLAVIIYLNQKPFEPRERDYAYAASFYAFSIWIGLSVLGMFKAFKDMDWPELGKIAIPLGAFSVVLFAGGMATGLGMMYLSAIVIGAFALMIALRKSVKSDASLAIIATLICLPVPILMGVQGWDDHDRSDRFTAKALANNYMVGCSPNSVLFTNGDNDTFPLWYLQEVEGQQTDLRVCNLSLFSTDWYTAQMKRKAYESEPLPISFEEHEYRQNRYLDAVYLQNAMSMTIQSETMDAKAREIMNMKIKSNPKEFREGFVQACNQLYALLLKTPLATNQPALLETVKNYYQTDKYFEFKDFVFKLRKNQRQLGIQDDQLKSAFDILSRFNTSFDYLPLDYFMNYLHDERNLFDNRGQKLFLAPTLGFSMPVDKQHIIDNALVDEKYYDRIADTMKWRIPAGKTYISKAEIMMLDIINNFNWERDLYFAGSASPSTYMGLDKYFLSEGLIYKLVPVNTEKGRNPNTLGEVNKAVSYDNLMVKYIWGNMEKEGVLVDYYTKRGVSNYRIQFNILADAYASDYEEANRKIDFLKKIDKDSTAAEVSKLEAIKAESKEKVISLLDKSLEVMPQHKIPFGRVMPYYVGNYYAVEAYDQADALALAAVEAYKEELDYYLAVDAEFSKSMLEDALNAFRSIHTIFTMANIYNSKNEELKANLEADINYYVGAFESKKSEYKKAEGVGIYNSTMGAFIDRIRQQQP
ncbi:MAG: DUF2723 domain-containing protein [Putridiphycobacter sp.]|nr:DUF2723 domain-containing protein [Putridiphycobacter sp.]